MISKNYLLNMKMYTNESIYSFFIFHFQFCKLAKKRKCCPSFCFDVKIGWKQCTMVLRFKEQKIWKQSFLFIVKEPNFKFGPTGKFFATWSDSSVATLFWKNNAMLFSTWHGPLKLKKYFFNVTTRSWVGASMDFLNIFNELEKFRRF